MNNANGASISILIATRDRSASLLRTLDSLFVPSNTSIEDWEVIVADNGSKDDTSDVCRMFSERYPDHFKFVHESRGGKSCALNKGIQMCQGEVLALIDDDVICHVDYLDAIRRGVAGSNECILQGRVHVDYDGKLPDWFDEHFESMMCKIDLGDNIRELPREFWGLNVVLPMRGIAEVGGFCPEMGPGAIGLADDAELSRRLRNAQYRLLYHPGIVVRHQISSHRLRIGYLLKRSYIIGLSTAYYREVTHVPLWRYSAYIFKEILSSIPRLLLNLATAKWNLAMRTTCEHLTSIGFVCQHWRFRIAGRPTLTVPVILIPRLSSTGQPGPLTLTGEQQK
jgi:glycosyltransferase involved in cell wall biosynthesis